MIEITDKTDGAKKLRRGYEDYLPLETQPIQETEIPETPETSGEETQPTTETPKVETGEEEKTE